MGMRYRAGVIRTVCAAMCVFASAAGGADLKPDELLRSLYGARLEQAVATREHGDDVTLAAEMLTVAKDPGTPAELAVLLCDKAHELAMTDASGFETAVGAMARLAALVPDRLLEAMEKAVSVRQRQFTLARGDDKAQAGNMLITALIFYGAVQRQGGRP